MPAANIADIAWAPQTAKGSPAAASTFRTWLAGGEQPHSDVTKEDFEETTGGQMRSDSYISRVAVTGAPEMHVMPNMIGSLLYAVLGAKAVTGSSDPYTHTITASTSLPYYTFWRMLASGLFERFADCKVAGLRIHGESGKPLRVTPRIAGLTPSFLAAAEANATIEKTQRFLHYDGSGALLVEGVAASSISSFDIDIDRGVAPQPGDSLSPFDVVESLFTITVQTDQLVSDYALWNRLHYGSASPSDAAAHTSTPLELAGSPAGLSWTWTRDAGPPERSLKIVIPRVQVEPYDLQPSTGPDQLRRQVTYKAFAPASGSPITATLKNARATY